MFSLLRSACKFLGMEFVMLNSTKHFDLAQHLPGYLMGIFPSQSPEAVLQCTSVGNDPQTRCGGSKFEDMLVSSCFIMSGFI